MPSPEVVERALEQIQKRHANYTYFFSELASPDWIEPLAEKGFFSSPPSAVREAGGVSFPFWPESEYLARMAPEAPERVAAVMSRVPETDNERVHVDLTRAAAGLPPGLAARWASREAEWVSRQEHLYLMLPDTLGVLVAHLAKGGETGAAMRLARALLAVRLVDDPPEPDESPEPDDDLSEPDPQGFEREAVEQALRLFTERAHARFDRWQYERILQTHILELVQHNGLGGLTLLCDLLEDVLPAGVEGGESDDGWRWTVKPDGLPRGHDDPRHALVDAVRDGSLRLAEAGADVEDVAGLLQKRGRLIFRRIALHLLAEKSDECLEAATHLALDRENFYNEELWSEYGRLLAAVFPRLDDSGKSKVLGWVETGAPDYGLDVEDGTRRRWAACWRAERLGVLRGHLLPGWEKRYEEIAAEFGEPKGDSDLEALGSGPRTPVEESELARMPVGEISNFLKTWQPSGELFAPGPGGLGEAFRSVVSGSADRFVGSLDLFVGVEPTYARALVEGLRDAVKEGVPVEWGPVVGYLGWIAGQPRPLPERTADSPDGDLYRGDFGRDRDWGLARREAVGLLSDGFGKDAIDGSLREAAWRVIDRVAEDPDPTPEDDERPMGDPALRSFNTARGDAVHAVMRYALWVHRNTEEDAEPGGFGMDCIPEVRERFERHLDPEVEPSPAVRAVFGRWFPWLVLLDRGWAEAKIEGIFPDDSPALRDAAWDTYLAFCPAYNEPFELLRDQYSAAVDRLSPTAADSPKGGRDGSREGNLGKHLLAMVGRGRLSWADEDGLLRRFFENAPADAAAHAVGTVGIDLRKADTDIPPEVVKRFQRFWEELSGFASSRGGDRVEILKAYDLWFDSGRFAPEWAFDQLDRVIEQTSGGRFDRLVVKALAELAGDHPARSLSSLTALTRRDEHGWNTLGSEDNVRAILTACLKQETTRSDAEALVHQLGARGHLRLRDLLAN